MCGRPIIQGEITSVVRYKGLTATPMLGVAPSKVESRCLMTPPDFPERLLNLSRQMQQIFDEADAETSQYGQAMGLSCPPGCGSCCETPDIEATVLEFLPFAIRCWEDGSLEAWLQKLQENPSPLCPFFQPIIPSSAKGRCLNYDARPLICRLFGYAARRGKTGGLEHVACNVQRKLDEGLNTRFQQWVTMQTTVVPVMAEFALRITSLNPDLCSKRLPLREGMREALQYVAFYKDVMLPQVADESHPSRLP